jgi:Arc/MetJ family transcription regulator
MRRIQLDLDEDLWDALRAHARNQKATVSELVRVALRERYIRSHGQRMNAMQGFVGIRKRASEAPNAEESLRSLRRGDRLATLPYGSANATT